MAAGAEAAINQYLAGAGGGGNYAGGVMTFAQVAALAESVGLPGVTFAQIAKGESGFNPRAVGNDPGGTKGLGLWQITTKFNDDIIARFGGVNAMFDPRTNALAAKAIYDRQGIKAWYGTKFMTGTNLHWDGGGAPAGDGWGWGGWNARGGSGRFGQPTLIGVGEGRVREDVKSTPVRPRQAGGGGLAAGSGTVSVHVAVDSLSVRSDQDIDAVAEKVGQKILSAIDGRTEGVLA
jgi:hypothetical protein